MTNKRSLIQFLCIIGIGVVCILGSALLFEKFGLTTSSSLSPNGEYQVSYNRFSRVITIDDFKAGAEKNVGVAGDIYAPRFLWSPDGRYLAISYKSAADGLFQSAIRDFESDTILYLNIPETIDVACGDKVGIIVSGFLDNHKVDVIVQIMRELDDWKYGSVTGRVFDILQGEYIPYDEVWRGNVEVEVAGRWIY